MKLLIARRVEMVGPREQYILSYRIDASFEEMKLLHSQQGAIQRASAEAGAKDLTGALSGHAIEERSANLAALEETVRELKRSFDVLKGFIVMHMQYHTGKVDMYE